MNKIGKSKAAMLFALTLAETFGEKRFESIVSPKTDLDGMKELLRKKRLNEEQNQISKRKLRKMRGKK